MSWQKADVLTFRAPYQAHAREPSAHMLHEHLERRHHPYPVKIRHYGWYEYVTALVDTITNVVLVCTEDPSSFDIAY